jgi:hypothetical protein
MRRWILLPCSRERLRRSFRAYNERISKLNLAKRFPLDKMPLKKCPGGPGASAVPAK